MKKNPFYLKTFVIKKILESNIHIGGKKHLAILDMHSYFYGIRQNFYIYEPITFLLLFNKAILYLKYLISSDKKILFIGLPLGIEQLFLKLVKTFGHYVVDEKTIGVLTNYRDLGLSKKFKIKKKPSLIFIFRPLDPDHQILLKSLFSFNIPIMGFVNINDPVDYFDFPLIGCIDSFGGSFFVYNLFIYIFGLRNQAVLNKFRTYENGVSRVYIDEITYPEFKELKRGFDYLGFSRKNKKKFFNYGKLKFSQVKKV